jgi:hypothetical protein
MELSFIGTLQARKRPAQRNGYRAEGHAQYISNLAIAKAFRSQVKAGAIPLRQRLKNRAQAAMSLGGGQLLLGIWRGIHLLFHQVVIRMDGFANPMRREAVLQREVVDHAKKPAAEIFAGPAKLEVAVQRKENVLNDFFAIVHGQAKGKSVAQQAPPEFVEQADDFVFQLRGRRRPHRIGRPR